MRKAITFLFFLFTVLVAVPATAQIGIGIGTGGVGFGFNLGPGHRNRSMSSDERELAFLKDTLNLDKSQTAAVQRLIRDRGPARRARPEDRRRFEEGMHAVLTPGQYDRYTALGQDPPDRPRGKRAKRQKESTPPSTWDDVYQ